MYFVILTYFCYGERGAGLAAIYFPQVWASPGTIATTAKPHPSGSQRKDG